MKTPDPGAPSHHRATGYQNNYLEFQGKSLAQVLRWKWASLRNGLPPKPSAPIPQVKPDLGFLRSNAVAGGAMRPAVTWIGHSTVLAQLGGLNVLTDPVFSQRASPLPFAGPKRHQPPAVALAELPRIDLVLASHNHYDHLDAATVKALARQPDGPPTFVAPLGLKTWFTELGVDNTIELDWWQTHRVGNVDIALVPAQHWSARGLGDRMKTLWGGFAVLAADCHLFFAGDTGYSRDFEDIRQHFADRQTIEAGGGFDIALLPIGAYEPRWFMTDQHVNVDEAVKIHRDLKAKRSLGVHWGTFELTDEALDEPPRELAAIREREGIDEEEFFVLPIGGTKLLPVRNARQPAGIAATHP